MIDVTKRYNISIEYIYTTTNNYQVLGFFKKIFDYISKNTCLIYLNLCFYNCEQDWISAHSSQNYLHFVFFEPPFVTFAYFSIIVLEDMYLFICRCSFYISKLFFICFVSCKYFFPVVIYFFDFDYCKFYKFCKYVVYHFFHDFCVLYYIILRSFSLHGYKNNSPEFSKVLAWFYILCQSIGNIFWCIIQSSQIFSRWPLNCSNTIY